MPSPVGHLLTGAAVYLAGTTRDHGSRLLLAVALLGSIVPDADFLPGIAIGDMRAFHHGMSHSLMFALLFGGLLFVVARLSGSTIALHVSLLATAAYSLHVLLDFVNVNPGTRGVPLLWPLSSEQLGINLHLFGRFRYGGISDGIWSVVRLDNVWPLLCELAIFGAVVTLVRLERRRRGNAA